MICPECRKNVPDGFTVCPHCGLSMKSIDTLNRRQAFRTAQARVSGESTPVRTGGELTEKLRRQNERKKTVGLPSRADYIRLVIGLVTFVLLCLDWYSVKVNGVKFGTYSIFGTGRGGVFIVPIFFGIVAIVCFLAMIANTFINFRKLIPALKNTDTLRLEAMLYSAAYIIALIFALISAVSAKYYSITFGYVAAVVLEALFAFITFTQILD